MKADRYFSFACAVILLASVTLTVQHGLRPQAQPDPRAQLDRFLAASGLTIESRQEIIQGEELLTVRLASCREPAQVLYLPAMARISAPARALVAARPDAVLIHDGRIIGSLGASSLIPRWIWRRALVNFQVSDDNPWVSIVLAVFPPRDCAISPIDWALLPAA